MFKSSDRQPDEQPVEAFDLQNCSTAQNRQPIRGLVEALGLQNCSNAQNRQSHRQLSEGLDLCFVRTVGIKPRNVQHLDCLVVPTPTPSSPTEGTAPCLVLAGARPICPSAFPELPDHACMPQSSAAQGRGVQPDLSTCSMSMLGNSRKVCHYTPVPRSRAVEQKAVRPCLSV